MLTGPTTMTVEPINFQATFEDEPPSVEFNEPMPFALCAVCGNPLGYFGGHFGATDGCPVFTTA